MPAGTKHFAATAMEALHAALQAIQQPGFLDKAGAAAIALFVLACWLFAPSAGRSR